MDGQTLGFLISKVKSFSRQRKSLCLSRVILMSGLLLLSSSGLAGEITIPWTVDLFIPSSESAPACAANPDCVTVQSFASNYTAMELHPPVGPNKMELDLATRHHHSYTVHLPFEITISAPDQVSAGQTVFFDSSAVLAGTPTFTTSGNTEFSTHLFADDVGVELGNPPDTVSFGGLSLTVAGDRSYTDTDNTADETLTRTKWLLDPWGNLLKMAGLTRFEGYEMQTSSDDDAWGGHIELLKFAGNFFAPAAVAGAVMDVSVGPEYDIIEETYLATQFVTGYYTDDGLNYDNFLINGADQKGYITIPDTLSSGDTYEIQMSALGLGFSTLFEYMLQGNIDVDLVVFSHFHEDITEAQLGDEILVDSWVDRFQYVQFLAEFLTAEEFSEASLSFDVISGLEDEDGTLEAPALELAKVDPFIQELVDDPFADQGQQSFYFPADPATDVIIEVTAVPEPSILILLTSGIFGLLAIPGRRKKYH
jgi:hypothetical protein